jgi:hypothetical protein
MENYVNPDNSLPSEFYSLLERKFAGRISDEEQMLLEKYLCENDAAIQYYLTQCEIEGHIAPTLRMLREKRECTGVPAGNRIRFARRIVYGVAATAAVAALAITGFLYRNAQDPVPISAATMNPEPGGALCRVSMVFGASFQGKRIETRAELGAETFTIDAGAVELAFNRGARVLLEAPASLAITGDNACRLAYGKAVADVPDSAKGFVIEGPKDRVVDYGTRFALEVTPDGERTLLGVLNGVVDLEHSGKKVRLFTDYAVERRDDSIKSVPFPRENFLTEMPSQEFSWNLDGLKFDTVRTLRFDITRLIKTPGEIHVIFKRLLGYNGIFVKKITLERDGMPVLVSNVPRHFGRIYYTRDNFFPLTLPENTPLDGKWELVAEATCRRRTDTQPVTARATAQGIFLFEKGALHYSVAGDFIGRWQFSHDEKNCVYELKSDGGVVMWEDENEVDFKNQKPTWSFKDGVATIDFNEKGSYPLKLILRNKNTMIFLNETYRNACRME